MLTRDQILSANDLPSETVPVPEWGEGATVKVRTLPVGEFLAAQKVGEQQPGHFAANWIIATVTDDEGKPLFTIADIDALEKKSIVVVERLVKAALRMNLRSEEDKTKN
jgi:hypothetical protein